MSDFTIKRITHENFTPSLKLAEDVFMEFEAKDYPPEGTESFKAFLYCEETEKRFLCGNLIMWGAFDKDKQIATFAIRDESHLSLLFVDKNYHRKGVATALWNEALSYISQNEKIKEVTVNSSPYGLPFYKKIGFRELSEEQTSDGIRYIPMKYIIERQ